MLHNDLIERIEELETALATTERAYREQKDGFELLRDEMKEIALALGRSKTDGESDCDWYDMAGEIREQKERADRLEKLLNPPPKLMRFVE
jgi:chromosome segregation ATPase